MAMYTDICLFYLTLLALIYLCTPATSGTFFRPSLLALSAITKTSFNMPVLPVLAQYLPKSLSTQLIFPLILNSIIQDGEFGP